MTSWPTREGWVIEAFIGKLRDADRKFDLFQRYSRSTFSPAANLISVAED